MQTQQHSNTGQRRIVKAAPIEEQCVIEALNMVSPDERQVFIAAVIGFAHCLEPLTPDPLIGATA